MNVEETFAKSLLLLNNFGNVSKTFTVIPYHLGLFCKCYIYVYSKNHWKENVYIYFFKFYNVN